MSGRNPGREFIPPVAKIRLQYAKRGRLRFSSHRDFQRAFERALRRAEVPMAYSAGFRPHPKISYANAAPTGAASEAEYIEIGVMAQLDPAELRAKLNDAMPPGLDIVDAVVAQDKDLVARLEGSVWQIALPGLELATLDAAVAKFLDSSEVMVSRRTKSGMREFDSRAAVLNLETSLGVPSNPDCAIMTVVVANGTPSVRPDDVLEALKQVADLVLPEPPQVTRLAQGPLASDKRSVGDPLAPDRAGADSLTR